jgi:hypothetical protein
LDIIQHFGFYTHNVLENGSVYIIKHARWIILKQVKTYHSYICYWQFILENILIIYLLPLRTPTAAHTIFQERWSLEHKGGHSYLSSADVLPLCFHSIELWNRAALPYFTTDVT